MKYRKTTTEQASKILLQNNRIALFSHTNPDGDTIGASLALCLALRKIGKIVDVFCDSELSKSLLQFDECDLIKRQFEGKYDLFVSIDCGDIFRTGEFSGLYADFEETLTIDHHGGEYFSRYNCLYGYASTCQIVYEILKLSNIEIDSSIATYLYMGLCTDTGNFAHNNTDKDCFLMAADLVEKGADNQKVYRVFFRDTSIGELRLQARVINRLRSYYDNKMILFYVNKSDLDEFGLESSATSGLVSFAINVDTARVGVCVSEYSENVYKVSMRGKDFNVREVCEQFGGGGHLLASGCMISGFLEDVIEKIVRVVGFTI